MKTKTLKFGVGNAKLSTKISTFSVPSGFTCPAALDCLAKADRITGKITDGEYSKFRCFSASAESAFKQTRLQRWENFEILRNMDMETMIDTIHESLPNQEINRVHVSGDFFNQKYFDAWMQVAKLNPDKLFYAYTKSLNYWVDYLSRFDIVPVNFVLTASRGGRYDTLISEYNLREAVVVYHPNEAAALGLEIDHDDSHAMVNGASFALLLHGIQPKNSKAASALKTLKQENIQFAYSR